MAATSNETATERLNGYVTDVLALETHIRTAIAGQIEDLDESSAVKSELTRIHALCDAHIRALEALTQHREQNLGGVSKVVKQAVSSILGAGASAIDFIRTEKLPKDLRDNYTAVSLAYIGNLMLHTSALAFGDAEVASVAKTNLSDHARVLMALQRIIPAATVEFLHDDGMAVDASVLPAVADAIESAWK